MTETIQPIYIKFKDGSMQIFKRKPTRVILCCQDSATIVADNLPLRLIRGKWVYEPQ